MAGLDPSWEVSHDYVHMEFSHKVSWVELDEARLGLPFSFWLL